MKPAAILEEILRYIHGRICHLHRLITWLIWLRHWLSRVPVHLLLAGKRVRGNHRKIIISRMTPHNTYGIQHHPLPVNNPTMWQWFRGGLICSVFLIIHNSDLIKTILCLLPQKIKIHQSSMIRFRLAWQHKSIQ